MGKSQSVKGTEKRNTILLIAFTEGISCITHLYTSIHFFSLYYCLVSLLFSYLNPSPSSLFQPHDVTRIVANRTKRGGRRQEEISCVSSLTFLSLGHCIPCHSTLFTISCYLFLYLCLSVSRDLTVGQGRDRIFLYLSLSFMFPLSLTGR